MITRRNLLRTAPAGILGVVAPSVAEAVPVDPMDRLRAAWAEFCASADALVGDAVSWNIMAACGRDGEYFLNFGLMHQHHNYVAPVERYERITP